MCRRFCATMRRPASSNFALTLPVRLRRVASGLMMENVRSIAMMVPHECWLFAVVRLRRGFRAGSPARQPLPPFDSTRLNDGHESFDHPRSFDTHGWAPITGRCQLGGRSGPPDRLGRSEWHRQINVATGHFWRIGDRWWGNPPRCPDASGSGETRSAGGTGKPCGHCARGRSGAAEPAARGRNCGTRAVGGDP